MAETAATNVQGTGPAEPTPEKGRRPHPQERQESQNKPKDKKNEIKDCTISELRHMYDIARTQYAPEQRRIKLLDAIDSGDVWKAVKMKFPSYQILPDTNFISYVKSNLTASLYSVTKAPSILATSEEDKELCMRLNIAFEKVWNRSRVGVYQLRAGERAALCNMGITQVGWDNSLTGGSGDSFYKGNVVLKNIDPIKFMRDPFATCLDDSKYCMTVESYHISVLKENPNYRDELKDFSEETPLADYYTYDDTKPIGSANKYATLICIWVKRDDGSIDEYHTLNMRKIIYKRRDIKPRAFPFAILHCNVVPDGKLFGTSECAKIFANYLAYNLLDSVAMTAEYKNQNPPKFISSSSGLDIFQFAKYCDSPGRAFIVNGDATKAVHYHEYPMPSSNIPKYKQDTAYNIQMVSGVDGRYTGRDTGSVITTGGVEDMLNRVTLIDTPKILLYEDYTVQLARLILGNFVEFSPSRKFFVKDPQKPNQYKTVELDFPNIENDTLFEYEINISSELPKNKARIAEAANQLMEKQMQYNKDGSASPVQLITEEEWLEMQDLPFKERMMERMGMQRELDMVEQVSQTLFQYADLVNNGMEPDDAVQSVAQTLLNKKSGNPEPGMPNPVAAGAGLDAMLGGGGAPMAGGGQQPPMGGVTPDMAAETMQ